MKPLFDGVCKFQKWVENANQTQLKPIIWYTSWYFSKNSTGGYSKMLPPPTESLFTPLRVSVCFTWLVYCTAIGVSSGHVIGRISYDTFWYNFDTVLCQFLETGTSDRCLIGIVQLLRFSGFSLYPLSFFFIVPLKVFLRLFLRITVRMRSLSSFLLPDVHCYTVLISPIQSLSLSCQNFFHPDLQWKQ